MKKAWRRLLAVLLCVVLAAGLLPAPAYAAVRELAGGTAVENAALLEALRAEYGGDAEALLAVLEQYGLLDEDGNLKTSEKIVMDGVAYTLEELESVLDDPAADLSRVVTVDGTAVTLEDLKLMVEIERELARIQAAYFTPKTLNDAQKTALASFYQAAQNGDVLLYAEEPYPTSGYDHAARVSMKVNGAPVTNGAQSVVVTFTLNRTLAYPVSFSYQTLEGSALAGTHYMSAAGTVTFPAGETTQTVTISLLSVGANWDTAADLWNGKRTFYIRAYDPVDILFSDEDGSARTTLTREIGIAMDYNDFSKEYEASVTNVVGSYPYKPLALKSFPLSDGIRYMLNKGYLNQVTLSAQVEYRNQNGIYNGPYYSYLKAYEALNKHFAGGYSEIYYRGYSIQITGPLSYTCQKGYQISPLNGYTYNDAYQSGWTTPTNDRIDDERQGGCATPGDSNYIASPFPDTGDIGADVAAPAEREYYLDAAAQKQLAAEDNGIHISAWARKARVIGMVCVPDDAITGTANSALWIDTQPAERTGWNIQSDSLAYLKETIERIPALADDWVGENGVTVRLSFSDKDKPDVTSITAPDDVTFYAGDTIPITVAFDEPVRASDVDFRVAGSADGSSVKLTPADPDLIAERIVFLYTVGETDTSTLYPSHLSYKDLSGNAGVTLDGNSNFESLGAKMLCAEKIKAPLPQDALGALSAAMSEDDLKKPVATLTIPLSGPPQAVEDVLALGALNREDGKFYLDALQVSLNGGTDRFPFYFDNDTAPTELACVIPLDYNTSGVPVSFTAELWWENAILLGRTASGDVPSTVFAAKEDFSIVPSEDFVAYAHLGKTLFYQDFLGEGETLPSLSLGLSDLKEDLTFRQQSDFEWTSSAPEVATISNLPGETWGQIALTGKSGEVSFTLTALNGGVEGRQVVSDPTAILKVDMGGKPFLSVPDAQKTFTITKGQSAVLNWTSNLSEKNGVDDPNAETTFLVELFAAAGGGIPEGGIPEGDQPLWSGSFTGTASAPASSGAIPAEYLTTLGASAYAARVSSCGLSLVFTINVKSPPAGVRLERPENLYILDAAGALDIRYTLTDFVRGVEGQEGAYELYITNSSGEAIAQETDLDDLFQTDGGLTGEFHLDLPKVALTQDDPNSYRDVYTVALKAKNGQDANWSYDSFLLYVYSDQAMKLWIDGEEAGSALTMTNVPAISALYAEKDFSEAQAAVLAMERNISLKNMISINYGDYAWGALCDRVRWSVSDSLDKGDVATVNYDRGGLYENITYFDRESYAPTDQFILSGLADGTAQVTAKHALTGASAALDLDVETLSGRLYLFQCYPKLTTTLTYTNGAGETRTLTSQSDGRAAVYEESGIASDVYCRSETKEDGQSVVYLGTIYRENLASGERDSTRLELYPLNNLQLRRAAQATLYFKQPDGAPYTGTITFRGGVYREGQYAPNAQFAFQAEQTASRAGTEDQTVTLGADGKLTLTMDITQFTTTAHPDPVQDPVLAGESIQYILELRFAGEGSKLYQPIFTSVDATLNEADITSSGESIYTLVQADGDAPLPFVAGQTVRYAEKGDRFSVLGSKGNVGPSTSYPDAYLSTSVLWWGDEPPANAAAASNRVWIKDGYGMLLPGQSVQNVLYPFGTMLVTTHTVHMDAGNMAKLGMRTYDARNMDLTLSRDGSSAYKSTTLPFKLVNMIGAPATETAESLYAAMEQLGGVKADGSQKMDFGDALLSLGMTMLASDSNYSTEHTGFNIKLSPTEDPMRFLGFITVNAGNMGSGHNVTGVYPADDSKGGNKATSDFDYMPSIFSIAKMCAGTYLSSETKTAADAIQGKDRKNIHFDLGGYVESEIVFNTSIGKWEIHALNGGFHAGGGLSYVWDKNMMVGPVPVVISMSMGATLEFSLDMQDGNYTYYPGGLDTAASPDALKLELTGTDYLTELRIYLYARAFAGIGFDISIVAMKVGIFGQIDLDIRSRFLTRPYLEEGDDHVQRTISNVGSIRNNTEPDLVGQKLMSHGMVGIEFLFKFLFISYEKIVASKSFTLADTPLLDWKTIEEIWAANGTINGQAVDRLFISGEERYAVDLGAQVEDRSYLSGGGARTWGSPSNGGIRLFSLDPEQGVVEALQTNAYPYAAPVVSSDGELMVYLSDMGSTDVERTRAVWSTRVGDQFQEGRKAIDEGGYGDSALQLAGTGKDAVAVWVRQSEAITKELTGYDKDSQPIYAPLTPSDQVLQTNSTEIMAAVWNGSTWKTTRLTENGTPDLSPVVAYRNDTAIVAWRSAIPTSGDSVTTFDQQDNILYKTYKNGVWSEPRTLYDGSSAAGAVKGLQIAMMADGTAAVAYTLDTDNGKKGTAAWETLAAIIPAGGSEDGVRTLRLTDDETLDENPQVAAVTFGGEDGAERFVVGWHTQRLATVSHNVENDIRLAAFDADGALYNGMPDSVGVIAAGTGLTVGSNFHFAKNASSIRDLALVWTDSVAPENGGSAGSLEEAYQEVGYDVLKAVKFIDVDGRLSLSAAVEVADMGADSAAAPNTLVDHFDAWMEDGAVRSILLGTSYSGSRTKTVEVQIGDETQIMTLSVAAPVSGMYTATGAFTNQIQVPTVAFDYDDIYLNTDIPVQFTVRNNGAAPIESVSIQVGDGTAQNFTGLRLMPNQTVLLTVSCPVGAQVANVDYTVEAQFQEESDLLLRRSGAPTASGKLYLDIPDVGFSSLKLVDEEAGTRTLQFSLYDQLTAPLRQGRDTVKVGFYADASRTQPLKDTDGKDLLLTIDSGADLALINAGGFSRQVTVDLSHTLAVNAEIPETGFPVYAMVWVEQAPTGMDTGIIAEYHTSNNYDQLTCQSLLTQYNGEAVHIDSTLTSDESGTTVSVALQNNSLLRKQSGNLIVTLLDSSGRVLAQQQSYDEQAPYRGLITLGAEARAVTHFTFPQKGASVSVTYSDLVLDDAANSALASLSLDGIPLTRSEDETGAVTYTGAGTNLSGAVLTLSTQDPKATVTVNGQSYTQAMNLPLSRGENLVRIVVTARDGTSSTYQLAVDNFIPTSDGAASGTSYPVRVTETEHGAVTVKPDRAGRGSTVTVTAKPDAGYQVGAVTVTRANGSTVAVSKKEDGTFTFTMPGAGVEVKVTFVPVGGWVNPFYDVPDGAWYCEAVEFVDRHGLMNGTGGGAFSPGMDLTRGMIAQILCRLEDGVPAAAQIFSDVEAHAWYAGAVNWAAQAGLVSGYGDGRFGPDDPITREQLALILYRYAQYKCYDVAAADGLSGFTDGAAVSGWARDAVSWAVGSGLISGKGGGILDPGGRATRAEVAAMLMRFLSRT